MFHLARSCLVDFQVLTIKSNANADHAAIPVPVSCNKQPDGAC